MTGSLPTSSGISPNFTRSCEITLDIQLVVLSSFLSLTFAPKPSEEEPVLLSDSQPLSRLVQQMASEQLAGRERGEEILDHYARLFFLTAADLIHRPDPARSHPYYPILSEVRAEIRSSPASQWTVPQLAAMAGVSVDYFQHLYRACFGVSPAADVIAARLDYGCYLLRTTDLPVWRVAELCGYHSDVHFMRQFRRTMGMTPTQYRG